MGCRRVVFLGRPPHVAAGRAVAWGLAACGYQRLGNIHPGLYGLVANLLIAVIGSLIIGKASASTSREIK